ncbi:MAG: tetratricopeptide repeat protein [Chloroflexi bacterium]|nr:MAG: tetratricopeptide repeat protein [Chloroflexota bacterium]
MATQDHVLAEKRLQEGIAAYNDGKMEIAAEALIEAEKLFRELGDLKRAGDCRSLLADVQRENNLIEQSITSYQRAMKLYQEAGRPLNEAQAALAIGHLERQQSHLDRAQEAYERARELYSSEKGNNAQGLGNVVLALGHLELQRGNIDRATVLYQEAISYFSNAQDSINEADARRSLADILRLARRLTRLQRLTGKRWRSTRKSGTRMAPLMRCRVWGVSTWISDDSKSQQITSEMRWNGLVP